MERLILARHGESEYSARGLVNGNASVAVGLTEAGVEQARALGRTLAPEPIDLCVTSALERTRATAALALQGRDVPITAWEELNDPRAGRFEGLPLAEYRVWAWAAGSQEETPGGGESRSRPSRGTAVRIGRCSSGRRPSSSWSRMRYRSRTCWRRSRASRRPREWTGPSRTRTPTASPRRAAPCARRDRRVVRRPVLVRVATLDPNE